MSSKPFLKFETVGDLLKQAGIAVGIGLFVIITYFYVYLPNSTNHGDSVIVPEVLGIKAASLDSMLQVANLRMEISDSAYSEDYGPLEVIHQFPQAGQVVKPNRKIYVVINRADPPTVPVPDIVEVSLINATAILKSNNLRVGEIIYEPSPFPYLVLELEVDGVKVEPGFLLAKGTVINLKVGDGAGPNQLTVGNLVDLDFSTAKLLISQWNLHIGDVIVPDGVDTTEVQSFVFRQEPPAGDSVRIGHPVSIWICPLSANCKGDSLKTVVEEDPD